MPSAIHMWDVTTKQLVGTYRGHIQTRYVLRACFGGVGQSFVASGSEGNTIVV